MASLLLILLLTACQQSPPRQSQSQSLLIFAAASLTDAYQEAGASFAAAYPQSEIGFNFGGSQQLSQQLIAGAPGDVFASADLNQMHNAVEAGRVEASQVQIFAANDLVIVYPAANTAQIASIQDLATPGLRLVMAAEEVPAGRYARHFLTKAADVIGAAYANQVLENVVSYELNVRAVLTKVMLGEADAGIVYRSDANMAQADEVALLEIPADLNVQAVYYIAPIVNEQANPLAHDFISFILSDEGQAVLQRHGFVPLADAGLD